MTQYELNKPPPAQVELPPHLRERTRVLRVASLRGRFVLYWMHHAVRAHENPALDVALVAAEALGLPVLVYSGLSSRLPHASDRHHAFMLEGFRDVQEELASRGIRHALHLGFRRDEREPLVSLAEQAALVVVEDFPAPPYPRWTRRLVTEVSTAVWAVDACCLVPMQQIGGAVERAYELRRKISTGLEGRMESLWPEVESVPPPFDGKLGFRPVDLARLNLAELCARSEIDHAVGPVPGTPGGSRAGSARWRRFLERGLDTYARHRTDPVVDGTSRMSPYLHHGHVSPFRLAREALEVGQGAEGARKFLDELVIWRELAHNFCFYNPSPGSFDALPDWARRTLARHAGDPRPRLVSWERLARARTGDALWDAAQLSLLRHGELHNNLRMTWCKALLGWTRSPEEALELAFDLNDRYALDGGNAGSYGGILWCFGLFDRPFRPELPVLGAVRPRSTEAHAKRLDLDRYRAKVRRPARRELRSVAVVGAGMSGLVAARTLRDHGLDVRIFDKARGGGGRMTTRREGGYRFDHGAQYFTVRDPRFRRYVDSWADDGVAACWQGRIVALDRGEITPTRDDVERFVGVPGMSSITRHLAADLEPVFSTRVARAERRDRRWHLLGTGGASLGTYDAVVVTTPPEQALPLLADAPEVARWVRAVDLQPCWAVMVVFPKALELDADGAFVSSSPLSWVARNSSKPGRPPADSWVLHASPEWSAEHVEMQAGDVAELLLAAFSEAAGIPSPEPVFVRAHRWLYSIARDPFEVGCLWDSQLRLGTCGDWCQGSRVEGAFLSGMAIAGRVLGLRDPEVPAGQLELPGLVDAPAPVPASG